ncbi:MAG: hypothetical protein NTU76_00920 [Candidatus Taylorbacteria bacterium]|nr:hypothetical protein [Candidatus Taylorbacteria bacterium]
MDEAIEKAKQRAISAVKENRDKIGCHDLARIAMQTGLLAEEVVNIFHEVKYG